MPQRRVRVEFPRDGKPGGTFAHELRRAAAAREKSQGIDENRFAGARLSRDDGQTGAELDLEILDDGQIADRETPEHGESLVLRTGTPDSGQESGREKRRRAQHGTGFPEVYFFVFCPIGFAGIPPTIAPAGTDFDASPIDPMIASASTATPDRTTA